MASNIVADSVDGVLEPVLEDSEGELTLLAPNEEITEAFLTGGETVEGATVIASEDVLKEALSDFTVAARVATSIRENGLELVASDVDNCPAVVGDGSCGTIVADGHSYGYLEASDDDLEQLFHNSRDEAYETSDPYKLRTPAYTRIEESFTENFGEDAWADFDTVVNSAESIGTRTDPFDEVALSLLVVARHEGLLYDVSKWGEDTGVASKATFSRTKSHLEDAGLIDTEKVPIDVGRPRLRLQLRGGVAGSDVVEYPDIVREALGE